VEPPELLLDEILNLKKKVMDKEDMLRHNLDQVRIMKTKCK
jgi:aryl carrier-like protein